MDYKNYLEVIKELAWSTWYTKEIEDNEFNSIKEELEKIYKETNNPECLWLLSELYVHKSNANKREGKKYALKGLAQDYNNSGLHDNLVVCSDGIMVDFKKRNHNKIIEYYYDFIKIHPGSVIARMILIENLIDNHRLKEAIYEVQEAYKIAGDKTYLIEFYEGEILFKKGYQEDAVEFWQRICERNKDNYLCYFLFAEQCANHAMYYTAIEYYKRSFEMQKPPRRIDSLESMVQIYEIKRNYHEALNTVNIILRVYEKDYGLIEGEELQPYLQDKERFQGLINTPVNVNKIDDKDLKTSITLEVMNSLPLWFNPPEDVEKKSIEHREMAFFAAFDGNKSIGFFAVKEQNQYTMDMYTLGVLEEYHRQGIGKIMLMAVESYCKENGFKFITVKTLDASAEYEPYEQTRAFYLKNGFYPLEVFTSFWNEENPCLLLGKYIG